MNSSQKVPAVTSHKDFENALRRYFIEEVIGIRSPLTVGAKRNDLKLFVEFIRDRNGELGPLDQWIAMDSRAFLNHLTQEGYAPASINRALATLRAFAGWLVDQQLVSLNPMKGIRDLQLDAPAPKAIRDREWFRIQRAAELAAMKPERRYSQGPRNKAILAALNASGLRISELLGLKLPQFVGRKFVNVACKGGKVRTILISTEAAELVREYVAHERTPGSEFIFTNRFGDKLSRNGIAAALHRIAAMANAQRPSGEDPIELRPHLLRHRHAYKARTAHGDVFAAKRLGHSSLKHLERYAGLDESEESALLEKM